MKDKIVEIDVSKKEKPNSSLSYQDIKRTIYEHDEKCNVTILVQAYGRVEKTRECVESIIKYSGDNYKLLLMDNGTDGTEITDYYLSVQYDNKIIVKYNKNISGVFALDDSLKRIDTKYVVIVNNDIVVTAHWLENLLICAESDDSIGMVVPSSTNISNLQLENLGGFSDINEMQQKAGVFNVSDPSKWQEKIRLIPTATLYRREVFDDVGYYDLGFIHDFGDDDFTFRVRRAGYKLMLCKDTFVHHNHDQKSLPAERIEIMNTSREIFRNKYKGIDAWNDTGNHISNVLGAVNNLNNNEKTILAIDVKCGVPLLELKNLCRSQNLKVSYSKSYTTDAKYFIDLQSISDDTVCGNIETLLNNEEKKYDFIVLGNPINTYQNPFKLLTALSLLLNKNGYVIFCVRNTNNVISLLNMLDNTIGSDELQPKSISYKDFLNKLSEMDYTDADVNLVPLNVSEDLTEQLRNLILSMDIDGAKERVFSNILTQDYWITARK